jgi:multidrug efflux pump subunit AcrB
VKAKVPGLDIETAQLMEDLIGDLTSVPEPIEVKLYSENENALRHLAPKVADALGKVSGIVEVVDGTVPAGDALTIQVDRVKAGLEGVDPDALTKEIEDMLEGNVTTQIQTGPKLVGVRVWLPPGARRTMRDIENLQMRAPGDGHLFPLKRVATLIPVTGQPEITREDLRRMVTVTARISGRDLGSAARDVKKALDTPGLLPANVPYTMGGLYEQQQIAFRGLTLVMIAAIVLVFLLLLFLYESFRAAGAMLLVAILAVAGVYIGLWVTGTEFNITSRMGMTMVVGIVTEISIFYYSEYQELAGQEDRLVQAGINRMRPIMMTSFAAILALLPLALGLGNGADMLRPLAIAIISGLVCALPLVLVVLPAALAMMGAGRPSEPDKTGS